MLRTLTYHTRHSRIHDSEVKKRLLALRPFPKLQAVLDLCSAEETAEKDRAALSGPRSANQTSRNQSWSKGRAVTLDTSGGSSESCGACSYPKHLCGKDNVKGQCPAKGKEFPVCKKPNHFAKTCRSQKTQKEDKVAPRPKTANAVIHCRGVTSRKY